MHISGLVHVNINVADFDRSRSFYEALGFRVVWMVPSTNSAEVAAAVGMPPYRVKGGLMALEGANPPLTLDILEWQSPTDAAAPYPHLYHRGIARIALATTDIDGKPTGGRFVCFRDPDGTVMELVEMAGAGELLKSGKGQPR
jgi:catechol 2,3-dioxygenase-like lactoylglutathione lyase family enzyme